MPGRIQLYSQYSCTDLCMAMVWASFYEEPADDPGDSFISHHLHPMRLGSRVDALRGCSHDLWLSAVFISLLGQADDLGTAAFVTYLGQVVILGTDVITLALFPFLG